MNNTMQKYYDDIMRDLSRMIAIPSVNLGPEGDSPFGIASREALRVVLDRAKELGLSTLNVDDYAGHAEYGEGDDYVGVLVHLDVVPVDSGWTFPPFELTEKDGRLYGRGVVDDKGPAIAALYCLKALKDEGILGEHRIRVIFGTDEEQGMRGMKRYFSKQPLPVMAFSPDSDYPIYNREKGILNFWVQDGPARGLIRSISGGSAFNTVTKECVAVIDGNGIDAAALQNKAEAYTVDGHGISVSANEDGTVTLTATGRPAHGASPQLGFNAFSNLARFLVGEFGEKAGAFLNFIAKTVGLSWDGKGFGIACEDEQSGPLTFNIGVIDFGEEHCRFSVDIRYPVTADGEGVIRTLCKYVQDAGFTARLLAHKAPLYVPEDCKLISILADAYESVTGKKAELCSTGGGTYARMLENRGVSFGPAYGDEAGNIHSADEYIEKEAFLRHIDICYDAMRRMMEPEL